MKYYYLKSAMAALIISIVCAAGLPYQAAAAPLHEVNANFTVKADRVKADKKSSVGGKNRQDSRAAPKAGRETPKSRAKTRRAAPPKRNISYREGEYISAVRPRRRSESARSRQIMRGQIYYAAPIGILRPRPYERNIQQLLL